MGDNEQELVIKISAKNLTKEGFAEARSAIAGLAKESEKGKPATKSFFESLRDGKMWTDALTGTVSKFAAGFTIASLLEKGATAAIRFGREAFANAGEILKLSKQTDLSTDAIQRFQMVALRSESTVQDWTDAVFKLGVNLAGGGTSVRAALDKVGLSYDSLRNKSPEQQFVTVANRLREVEDVTERNAIANELFGKGWKNIAAGVVDGHLEMAQAAKVSSRESIEALNRSEEAWKTWVDQGKRNLTSLLGDHVRAWEALKTLDRESKNQYERARTLGQGHQFLMAHAEAFAAKGKEFGKDIKVTMEPAVKSYSQQLKEAAAGLSGMTAATKAEILAAQKLGLEEDELFRKFDINKGVLALLTEEEQKHTTATKEATRKAEDRREALDRIRKSEVAVTAAQRESILALKKREVAEGDIAIALGVTAAQIKQVAEADEKATKAAAAFAEDRGKRQVLLAERLKEVNAQQLKMAEEKAGREIELLGLVMDAERQRELRGTHGVQRQLIEIRQAEKAELDSIATKYDANSASYSRLTTLVRERYQHERDLATGTAETVVERMRAQGVGTRDDLRATADEARRDYEQMRDSGLYTAEQLRAAWKKWYDADKQARGEWAADWLNTLDRLGAMFEQAANIGGETFGGIARWLGTVVSASKMAVSGAADFKQGLGKIGDGDTVNGMLDVAAGVVSIVAALDQATQSGNRFQRVMGGAMVGAQAGASIGGLFGPMGAAVGAAAGGIIGGLVGAFRKDHVKDTMKAIGREYGVQISEGLAKEINELAKKVSGPTEKARKELATLLSLDKIIAEGGGVTSGNVAKYGQQALQLFDTIKRGGKDGAAAVTTLNTVFGQLEPIAAKTGHVADASLLQIVKRARDAGQSIAAIDAFVEKHLSSAQEHLGRFLSATGSMFSQDWREAIGGAIQGIVADDMPALTDSMAEWNRKVALLSDEQRGTFQQLMQDVRADIQQGFEDAGVITETTFNAMRAGGKGLLETVRAIGPSLDELIAVQEKLGLTGNDTFSKLLRWREIVKNNEPLIEQIDSMNGLMLGLGNAIGVNQAGFAAFGRTAVSQFERLVAAGATGEDALEAMAPTIQTLIELQDRFGFTVDDATQKLIDEAKAAGLVGDQHKSASERMVDGINKVVERMDAMLEGLGIRLPRAVKEGVDVATKHIRDGLGGAIADIDRDIKIRVGVEVDDWTIDYDYDDKGFIKSGRTRTVRSYASGGIAVGRQMAWVGDSPSRKEIIGDVDFMTKALAGAIGRVNTGTGGTGGGPLNVYVAVDPSSGRARVMSEHEKRQIQSWIFAGEIAVPQQNITRRPS